MSDQSPPPAAPASASPLSEADDKQWAGLAHLGGILSFLPSLIIWLIFKDRGPKTNVEAKEALNFQITLAIVQVANFILGLILTPLTFGIWGIIQFLIWAAAAIVSVVFSIIGFTRVNAGGSYRYPFAIRLIK